MTFGKGQARAARCRRLLNQNKSAGLSECGSGREKSANHGACLPERDLQFSSFSTACGRKSSRHN
jgi:hypothetical protein